MSNSENTAKSALRELVRHVFQHSDDSLEGITYQELAYRIGRINKHGQGHAHGMGKVLGDVGQLLDNLQGEWGERIPVIRSLVVQKSGKLEGLPDERFVTLWPHDTGLSIQERQDKIRAEYKRISDFGSRWNNVLRALELEPIEIPEIEESRELIQQRYGGGGESPQHKALKEHVATHPELIGAHPGDDVAIEYTFPSLDAVDVLIRSVDCWTAVEVKSRISDKLGDSDYRRGIYQCVKYRALLEAMRQSREYPVPDTFRVILLLESRLPEGLRSLMETLGIELIEKIVVPQEGIA